MARGSWQRPHLAVPFACLHFLTAHVLVLAMEATAPVYLGQLASVADGAGQSVTACTGPYAALLLTSACWSPAVMNQRLRALRPPHTNDHAASASDEPAIAVQIRGQ
ncbi:hypothetical protein ACP4OV_017543 [Aristida adscensionis]